MPKVQVSIFNSATYSASNTKFNISIAPAGSPLTHEPVNHTCFLLVRIVRTFGQSEIKDSDKAPSNSCCTPGKVRPAVLIVAIKSSALGTLNEKS